MNYPQRKRIRRKDYDYRQSGAYFCTVCVHRCHRHKDLFARFDGENLVANRFGRIVENCWLAIPSHRQNVTLDAFMVMPNHVHLVIFLENEELKETSNATFGPQPAGSLGHVLGAWKGEVKRQIGVVRDETTVVWQPRFHDHIIRNEHELAQIRRYIENNPANWINDRCHPRHRDFDAVWQGASPDDEWEIENQ